MLYEVITGRSHPADFLPTYYGHSIGWWDGDTLVVETVNFNDETWLIDDDLSAVRHRLRHSQQEMAEVETAVHDIDPRNNFV